MGAMLKARLAKEVVLRMPNAIGTLNTVAKALSDKGFNILAVSAWVEGADVVIRLVVDDTTRAADTLKARGYQVREADVVIAEVPHKPGMLRNITDRLAHEEIDIHHLYATSGSGEVQGMVVFGTAHNDRALSLLSAGH